MARVLIDAQDKWAEVELASEGKKKKKKKSRGEKEGKGRILELLIFYLEGNGESSWPVVHSAT